MPGIGSARDQRGIDPRPDPQPGDRSIIADCDGEHPRRTLDDIDSGINVSGQPPDRRTRRRSDRHLPQKSRRHERALPAPRQATPMPTAFSPSSEARRAQDPSTVAEGLDPRTRSERATEGRSRRPWPRINAKRPEVTRRPYLKHRANTLGGSTKYSSTKVQKPKRSAACALAVAEIELRPAANPTRRPIDIAA